MLEHATGVNGDILIVNYNHLFVFSLVHVALTVGFTYSRIPRALLMKISLQLLYIVPFLSKEIEISKIVLYTFHDNLLQNLFIFCFKSQSLI